MVSELDNTDKGGLCMCVGILPVYQFMWGVELMKEISSTDVDHPGREGDIVVPVFNGNLSLYDAREIISTRIIYGFSIKSF